MTKIASGKKKDQFKENYGSLPEESSLTNRWKISLGDSTAGALPEFPIRFTQTKELAC